MKPTRIRSGACGRPAANDTIGDREPGRRRGQLGLGPTPVAPPPPVGLPYSHLAYQ